MLPLFFLEIPMSDPCLTSAVPPWPVIGLVEPHAPAPVGDRVPCHLFMPEVPWRAPLPPVIRSQHRRDQWLTEPPVRVEPSTDLLTADARAARIAAQTENEALKARLAASGVEQRRAVREAVLAEREACAKACLDVYGVDAIRARGAA